MRIFLSFLMVFMLVACATPDTQAPIGTAAEIDAEIKNQKEMVIRQATEEEARLYGLYYTLVRANTELCPADRVKYVLGFDTWNRHDIDDQDRQFVSERLRLGEGLQVRYVPAHTPAGRAGLMAGDTLVRLDGKDLAMGMFARRSFLARFRNRKNADITLTVRRLDREFDVVFNADQVCAYGFEYDREEQEINAFADGKKVVFARGMYRFAEDDMELATVLAHELAHNTMMHNQKSQLNAAIGIGIGLAIGVWSDGDIDGIGVAGLGAHYGDKAYSEAFEREADYVGLYYMARAGMDISKSANFWRRMSAENTDTSIFSDPVPFQSSHPTNPERFISIDKTRAEIEAKIKAGQPLVPNVKEGFFGYAKEYGNDFSE